MQLVWDITWNYVHSCRFFIQFSFLIICSLNCEIKVIFSAFLSFLNPKYSYARRENQHKFNLLNSGINYLKSVIWISVKNPCRWLEFDINLFYSYIVLLLYGKKIIRATNTLTLVREVFKLNSTTCYRHLDEAVKR